MNRNQILEIVEIYNQIEKYKIINWDEINRVYEYFNNKKEKTPVSKVWRIKSFVEENPRLLAESELESYEQLRKTTSILIKNEIPVPHLRKRKTWINENILQQ